MATKEEKQTQVQPEPPKLKFYAISEELAIDILALLQDLDYPSKQLKRCIEGLQKLPALNLTALNEDKN